MTQQVLNQAISRSTGETVRTIRRVGFALANSPKSALEPEDLCLAIDCPFCGHACHLMADAQGLPAVAECDPCDVYFGYEPEEVYAASSSRVTAA